GVGAVQLLAPSEPGVEARPEDALALNPAPAASIVERPAAEPPVDSAASFAAPPEVPEIVEEEQEDDASSSPDVEEPSAPAAQDVQDVSSEAPAPGSLAVAAVPWARVFVDGEDVGETPVEALSLPPGRHEVRLENPEFPAHAITVDVAPGEAERLAVSLWALVGRVTLEVHPWARVAVDGTHWDTVPPQQRPLVLAPGTHRLTLE